MATGWIDFAGIESPIMMTAVRTNGAGPDRAVIWAQLQDGTPDCSGTVTFTFGFNGTGITWRNALCDNSQVQATTKGHHQIFTILDSRWRWAKAFITGHYNARYANGSLIASSTKTTAQLIQLIFARIGVAVDVTLVTDTENQEVYWDRSNCADMLEEVLEARGYVVSLRLDDTAKIFPKGIGTALPATPDVVTAVMTVDPPEVPLNLVAVAAPTQVESILKLVPGGKDTDGSIKEAKDVSYNPGGVGNAAGWDGVELVDCASITDRLAQECALDTIGRLFLIKYQADGTQSIDDGTTDYVPGEITVTNVSQLLPISKYLLSTTVDIYGQTVQGEPVLIGTVIDDFSSGATGENTAPFTVLDKLDFDLDREKGHVMVKKHVQAKNEPILMYDPGPALGTVKLADLYLRCAYSVHDNTSLVKDKHTLNRNLGGYGEDQVVDRSINRELKCSYTPGTGTISSIADNTSTVDTELNKVLDNAQRDYGVHASNMIIYRGIYQYATDGVNLQIQWNCATHSHSPFSTIASQYAESIAMIPTTAQRAVARKTRIGKPIQRIKE